MATIIHRRSTQAPNAGHDQERQARQGAASAHSLARLVGLSGSQKNQVIPIPASGLLIGRGGECHLVLTDHRVSSQHAWIGPLADAFVLRDLQSTNGTFLNAEQARSVAEVELRSGDTIFFGSHQGDQFRFLCEPEPGATDR